MVIGEIICRFAENLQEVLIAHSDIIFNPLSNEGIFLKVNSNYKVDEEILKCEKICNMYE